MVLSRWSLALVLTAGFADACGGAKAEARPPAVVVQPPPPPPQCGAVDVDDHSVPPSDARASLVRVAVREKLFVLGACARPYHVRVNVTVDQTGSWRLQATLRAVVYRSSGEVVGDIPARLFAEHVSAEERATKEAEILRAGGESIALLLGEHFR